MNLPFVPRSTSLISSSHLGKPEPRPLEHILRHALDLLRSQLIHLLLAGDDVNLRDGDSEGRAEPDLVPDVQHEEDGQRDIRGEEVGHVELAGPEDLEAVGDGEERYNDEHNVRRVRL